MTSHRDAETQSNYRQIQSLLSSICPTETCDGWAQLWAAVGTRMRQDLADGRLSDFESAFTVVRDALQVCEPVGRRAGVAVLFGEFTRRAIAAGIDRTRFTEWFGPAGLLNAPVGRERGRVLYFDNGKGRGKLLAADGVVHFVTFSAIRANSGFYALEGGELVEFTSVVESNNGGVGPTARDVVRLAESDGTELR